MEVWCGDVGRVSVELGADGGHMEVHHWRWEEGGVCCIALRGRGWEEGVSGHMN